MTFDEAVKALGLTTGWRLLPFLAGGQYLAIRNERNECPLEVLAGVTGLAAAMDALDMAGHEAVRLASAADGAIAPWATADRHALMAACGLAPTEQA